MTIRFGVSPIAWANDDMPELGGNTPLNSILTDIRELGFAGSELGGKFPRDAAVLKPIMAEHQLVVVGGWYSSNLLVQSADAEIAAMMDHLTLLKRMGSTVFIIAETSNAIHSKREIPLAKTPRLPASDWAEFGQRMSQVASYVNSQGLQLAYHHHLGTVVETADDLERFLSATTAAVGLVLDTGHASLGGIDAVQVIARHPERIVHVHCKDVRNAIYKQVKVQNRSFLDGVLAGMFTAPGDGDLDFNAVMQALAAIKYSGWIIVEAEQDPALADPKEYSALGLRTLKTACAAAGLA